MEFNRGEQVEVIMLEEGFDGSYYAAKMASRKLENSLYIVKYLTLLKDDESGPLKELVDGFQLRPVPPPTPVMHFDVRDLVDAYENDGWWAGIIRKKLRMDYLVYFPTIGKTLTFPLEKLRVHQEWANGTWTFAKSEKHAKTDYGETSGETSKRKPAKRTSKGKQARKRNVSLPIIKEENNLSLLEEDDSGVPENVIGDDQLPLSLPPVPVNQSSKLKQPKLECVEEETGKLFKKNQLKMSSKGKQVQTESDQEETGGRKVFRKPKEMEFRAGEEVEVTMEEEGFEGSYYAAKVISKEGSSQYRVEFKTLLKEDESGPLEELVGADQLRPMPPHLPVTCFSLNEFADAYDGDGWWVGIINGKFQSDYFIYFPLSQEEHPYKLDQLRVHQDWFDGKWICSKTEDIQKPEKKPKLQAEKKKKKIREEVMHQKKIKQEFMGLHVSQNQLAMRGVNP